MDNQNQNSPITPKTSESGVFKSLPDFSSGKPDKAPTLRRNGAWWQPAMEIFASVSAWIVGPIVIALFLGKWLDKKFNSEPWLFLAVVGLAFFISCFGIVRITMAYIKKIEEDLKNQPKVENKKNKL